MPALLVKIYIQIHDSYDPGQASAVRWEYWQAPLVTWTLSPVFPEPHSHFISAHMDE